MSITIVSANPQMLSGGIDDQSIRPIATNAIALPTFLAKVYGFAKSGPTKPSLTSGNNRVLMYGAESFDETGKYATCNTVLSNILNAQGNVQMFQRLKPKDAGPNASIRLTLDILKTRVPVFDRMSDGSIIKNDDGVKQESGMYINGGYYARLVARQIPKEDIGIATEKPGEYTDKDTGVQSISFPLMDLEVPHFGEDGNNVGLRLWSETATGLSPMDDRIVANEKVYPFRMACLKRNNPLSTGKLVRTNYDASSTQVSFKKRTTDRNTGKKLYVGDVFLQEYQDFTSETEPDRYGPFGTLAVYDASIAKVLEMIYEAEAPFVDEFSDITGTDKEGEKYMINLLGGFSTRGVPYHSFIIESSGTDVLRASENSVVYATGGSDGTMNETILNELIREEVSDYGNPNSQLQDLVTNPESIIVDAGFELATKYALLNFIAIRRDTAVILSTHDVQGRTLDASQESSMGISLRTAAQLYPESELYGTHVCRAMVVGHSGDYLESQYPNRLPLSLEIAKKAAIYMGASNGRWKAGMSFDSAPRSVVSGFKNVNATFKPVSVRNVDWKNSLVTVQSFELKSLFFPALKTVYENDTSTLNSFFTMMVFCDLHKVGHRQWRNFTGSDKRSRAVLKRDAEKFIADAVKDKYDSRVVIIPEVYYTQDDIDRGYVWRTKIRVYANNMVTVNVLELAAHRMDELTDAAG